MRIASFLYDSIFIVGTFERSSIAEQSIDTLMSSTQKENAKIIAVDSSRVYPEYLEKFKDKIDIIHLPNTTCMATARNIGAKYAKDRYVYEWIGFLEDDVLYKAEWYRELVGFADKAYGQICPHGLVYGGFSATPGEPKLSEEVKFDERLDCFSEPYGSRADQRLFKATYYENVVKSWDEDLLGISSCQTGKQSNRSLMNGFTSANIGHRGLCEFVSGQESTWENIRDIGPAAFIKDFKQYSPILRKMAYKDINLGGKSTKINTNKMVTEHNIAPTSLTEPRVELPFRKRIKYGIRRRLRKLLL